MKNIFITASLAASFVVCFATNIAQAQDQEASVEQLLFDGLEGQFEYRYGVTVGELSINTIVRHDNSTITCSKETTTIGNQAPAIVYECSRL